MHRGSADVTRRPCDHATSQRPASGVAQFGRELNGTAHVHSAAGWCDAYRGNWYRLNGHDSCTTQPARRRRYHDRSRGNTADDAT